MVLRCPLEDGTRTTLLLNIEDVWTLVLKFCQYFVTISAPTQLLFFQVVEVLFFSFLNTSNERLDNNVMPHRHAKVSYNLRSLVVINSTSGVKTVHTFSHN